MTKLTIEELKEKYPHHKIKYNPKEECKVCHGTGEYHNKAGSTTLCICTCVGIDNIGELFQSSIKKQRIEMFGDE